MNSATPEPTDFTLREVRFVIRGRVQGVGFRWWAREQAQRLGVSGDVRNRPDGTVQVHARASAAVIEDFAKLLKRGPPAARVDQVEEEPAEDIPTDAFEIFH